jgi:hypothetical protein
MYKTPNHFPRTKCTCNREKNRHSPVHLALLPLNVQVIGQPPALARRRKNTIQVSRKGCERNLRIDIEQRLAAATRRPHRERDIVLLEVLAVEGTSDGKRCGRLWLDMLVQLLKECKGGRCCILPDPVGLRSSMLP